MRAHARRAPPSWRACGRRGKLGTICAFWQAERGPGVCFKDRPEWSRCCFIFWCRGAPPVPLRRLSLLRVHIQQQRKNRSKFGQAKRGQIPKVVWRYSGPSLAGALRSNGPAVATCNMEHDMATSAPARVKTIFVVDLTHVPNDPFATTILGDLRARLIPPTRVCGPNGQPPESSRLERP